MLNVLPKVLLPFAALQTWQNDRDLPEWRGGRFRDWFASHVRIPRGGVAARRGSGADHPGESP
jgi:hypothetical protein